VSELSAGPWSSGASEDEGSSLEPGASLVLGLRLALLELAWELLALVDATGLAEGLTGEEVGATTVVGGDDGGGELLLGGCGRVGVALELGLAGWRLAVGEGLDTTGAVGLVGADGSEGPVEADGRAVAEADDAEATGDVGAALVGAGELGWIGLADGWGLPLAAAEVRADVAVLALDGLDGLTGDTGNVALDVPGLGARLVVAEALDGQLTVAEGLSGLAAVDDGTAVG